MYSSANCQVTILKIKYLSQFEFKKQIRKEKKSCFNMLNYSQYFGGVESVYPT